MTPDVDLRPPHACKHACALCKHACTQHTELIMLSPTRKSGHFPSVLGIKPGASHTRDTLLSSTLILTLLLRQGFELSPEVLAGLGLPVPLS